MGTDPGGPHTWAYPHHWEAPPQSFCFRFMVGPEDVISKKYQVLQTLWVQGPHFENDCCTDGFQAVLPGSEVGWYSV